MLMISTLVWLTWKRKSDGACVCKLTEQSIAMINLTIVISTDPHIVASVRVYAIVLLACFMHTSTVMIQKFLWDIYIYIYIIYISRVTCQP